MSMWVCPCTVVLYSRTFSRNRFSRETIKTIGRVHLISMVFMWMSGKTYVIFATLYVYIYIGTYFTKRGTCFTSSRRSYNNNSIEISRFTHGIRREKYTKLYVFRVLLFFFSFYTDIESYFVRKPRDVKHSVLRAEYRCDIIRIYILVHYTRSRWNLYLIMHAGVWGEPALKKPCRGTSLNRHFVDWVPNFTNDFKMFYTYTHTQNWVMRKNVSNTIIKNINNE